MSPLRTDTLSSAAERAEADKVLSRDDEGPHRQHGDRGEHRISRRTSKSSAWDTAPRCRGKKLILNLGYSNPVEYEAPAGIDIAVEGPTKLSVAGIDKQAVGQVAAIIRGFRFPNPTRARESGTPASG